MISRQLLGLLIIAIALIPFLNYYVSQGNPVTAQITGNTVDALNGQLVGYLLNKENIFNDLMNHYSSGLFQFDKGLNPLLDTYLSIETIQNMELQDKLSINLKNEIYAKFSNYYTANGTKDWFSPSYTYPYYKIMTIYGNKLTTEQTNNMISSVIKFKNNDGGFSKTIGGESNILETYYAVSLLKETNYDLSILRNNLITYLSNAKTTSDIDSFYVVKTFQLIGENVKYDRNTVIACLIKNYLPLNNPSDCALILRDNNIIIYLPTLLLLLVGWFVIVG